MTEIKGRRKTLINSINSYYNTLNWYLDYIIRGTRKETSKSFIENLDKKQSSEKEQLKNEIKNSNKAEGAGLCYLDLVIFMGICFVVPIIGQFAE